MAETLTVRLFGDTVKSEQLRLAHVNRLVSDLVSSMENSGLEIDQRFIRFTDGSEIMIKRVFGATTVHITANTPEPKKEEIVLPKKQRVVPHERISIVPAIEAYDYDENFKGLVICTSGTFEPPYIFVPIKDNYLNDFFDEWSAVVLDGNEPMKPKGFVVNYGTEVEKSFTVIPQTSEILIRSDQDSEGQDWEGEWTDTFTVPAAYTAPILYSGDPLDGFYETWILATKPFSEGGAMTSFTNSLKQYDLADQEVGDPVGYSSTWTGTYEATGLAWYKFGDNNQWVDSQEDLDMLEGWLYEQWLAYDYDVFFTSPFQVSGTTYWRVGEATASQEYSNTYLINAPNYYIGAKDRTYWGGLLRYEANAKTRSCSWELNPVGNELTPTPYYTRTEFPDEPLGAWTDNKSYKVEIVVDGETFLTETGTGDMAGNYSSGYIGYYRVGSRSYFLCARNGAAGRKYSVTRPFRDSNRFVETFFAADGTKTWMHAIGDTGYYGTGFFRLVQIREPMEPDIIQE